ncbi:PAS domain-containing sensor histidine kinase [Pontivivens ytuae]|uniref:histidine kinase n=1 Tax=Pontivivens ytuae TaxID=2789856 RepID=A0A7S9LQY6_9RHOB|nr:PAS domain-containing sensor histidine kinase [Pontivivens ytuae]QPH53657.1 PAS-domain containing protein [Pontivivens ytuae]
MTHALLDPTDDLARQNEKLLRISEVLMNRVEQATNDSGAAFAHFQRAAMLEDQVRERTADLERALDLLHESNARYAAANDEKEAARRDLASAIETIKEGFALFDDEDVLQLSNSRFGMHMLDLKPHLKPGLSFDEYSARVASSRYLVLPEGDTQESWLARRRAAHRNRHVMFNVAMRGDRWIQVSEHRTHDGQTVVMQTDITDVMRIERQERETLLDDQARLIRATLDHIEQGVCIFDTDRRLIGWNRRMAGLLLVPLERLRMGADIRVLYDQLGREVEFQGDMTLADVKEWARTRSGREPLRFELRHRQGRLLDVFAEEMPNDGFVISFRDVTAEREAARVLHEANEMLERRVRDRTLELEDALSVAERANASKSRFVAAASHDLLQPLSAAKLYLSSVQEDIGDAGQAQVLGRAQNALDSVEEIIDALLAISKLESGAVEPQIRRFELTPMLRQLQDDFRPHADLAGLGLHVVPCSAMVETDAFYLRRVLQNLIANAIRYTRSGKVLVGARRQRRAVRLEVWDTGPGIPKDAQDDIFKEFHRLGTDASAAQGMGLGLAIVERACAMMNLPLELTSTVGRGTGFLVTVPLAGVRPRGPKVRVRAQ